MRWPRIGLGLLFGLLTSIPALGVMYIGDQLAGLSFAPFTVFEFVTRILPGSVLQAAGPDPRHAQWGLSPPFRPRVVLSADLEFHPGAHPVPHGFVPELQWNPHLERQKIQCRPAGRDIGLLTHEAHSLPEHIPGFKRFLPKEGRRQG